MKYFRQGLRAVTTGAAICLLLGSAAARSRADLTFFTNPGDYQSTLSGLGRQDENVDYNHAGDISGPAELVRGDVKGTAFIDFMETATGGEDLVTPSGGQARVEAADGGLNSLYITPTNANTYFTAFTANPNLFTGDTGFARITTTSEDATFTYDVGQGQNFFGIIATNGQSFKSVLIETFTDSTMTTRLDIADVRQVRVETVPEPAFVQLATLLGVGGIGILKVRRRAKK